MDLEELVDLCEARTKVATGSCDFCNAPSVRVRGVIIDDGGELDGFKVAAEVCEECADPSKIMRNVRARIGTLEHDQAMSKGLRTLKRLN